MHQRQQSETETETVTVTGTETAQKKNAVQSVAQIFLNVAAISNWNRIEHSAFAKVTMRGRGNH